MAWYGSVDVRVRGRLVHVTLRYGAFMEAEVKQGKPLSINPRGYGRDMRRLLRALQNEERRNPGPFSGPGPEY